MRFLVGGWVSYRQERGQLRCLGTVLIMESWLIGVGWVIYGSQLFGRWFHDAWLRAWAHGRWGHPKPAGQADCLEPCEHGSRRKTISFLAP